MKSLNGFIGRTVAFSLNKALAQNGFANSDDINYNLMVETVQNNVEKNLADFVAVHVNDEAQKMLHRIKEEN